MELESNPLSNDKIMSDDEKEYLNHKEKLTNLILKYFKMTKFAQNELAVLSKVSKKTPIKFVKKKLLPSWNLTVTPYLKHNTNGFLSEKEKINFAYGLFIISGSEKEEVINNKNNLIEQSIIEILLKCIEKEKRRKKQNDV